MSEEIKAKVDALGSSWEQFKSANDARLAEIEKKGSADVLYTAQLEKINGFMDEQKAKLDTLEVALSAPKGASISEKEDKSEAEYKSAFVSFLRKGVMSPALESKALSVGSDPDGGYLVTPAMSRDITKIIFETSPIRQLASVETISTDVLEVIDDNNEFAGGWTGETTAITETNTAQIGKRSIPVHEVYAQPKATQKLIDDSSINIEAWISEKIADILARRENTAFVSGSGVSQPRGILTYAAGTSWGQIQQVNSGTSAQVTADGLLSLLYALKEGYQTNATFIANRSVVGALRLLKDSTNQYLWQPSYQMGQPDMIIGRPIMMASDMPVAAANSLSVAVADFKRAYKVVDRRGVTIMRDPFTEKPFVKFYATKRVGGDVTNFEAIKILKLAV
jgi:HK97 family phage major capsid protein